MSQPISIIVPTFARTALLCEVVECFRRLTYDGKAELVISNDCDLQTLTCSVPGVRIINQPTFPTFGHKINALYQAAGNELVLRCDDDDLFLPQTLTALTALLQTFDLLSNSKVPVARFRKMLQWTGDAMRVRSSSVQHGALVRRSAFFAAGGLKPLSAGYPDVEFWDRVTPRWFRGRWHHEHDGNLLTIHRADPSWAHVEGADRATGKPPMTEREWQAAQIARINIGEEPSGVVPLVPRWSRDWQAEADAVQKVSRE
ncbi:MAG: glycosyltransferase family 2 protein [Thiobacillus sp.]